MPRFSSLFRWLRRPRTQEFESWLSRQPKPPITFENLQTVDKPPHNSTVGKGSFYFVVSAKKQPKWVLFQCPCGCGAIVTLSLQKTHTPHWRLRKGRAHRPSLQPSIWRDIGCMSHFWVYDGRIYWCSDSGMSPDRSYRETAA